MVSVFAQNSADADDAEKRIKAIIAEAEVGEIYTGKVNSIVDFGAFVNFLGAKDGLVHISELCEGRVNAVTDVVKEGDELGNTLHWYEWFRDVQFYLIGVVYMCTRLVINITQVYVSFYLLDTLDIWVHLLDTWCEHRVNTCFLSDLKICFKVSWIDLECGSSELKRIDKDTKDNSVILASCSLKQILMSLV